MASDVLVCGARSRLEIGGSRGDKDNRENDAEEDSSVAGSLVLTKELLAGPTTK